MDLDEKREFLYDKLRKKGFLGDMYKFENKMKKVYKRNQDGLYLLHGTYRKYGLKPVMPYSEKVKLVEDLDYMSESINDLNTWDWE